MRIRWDEKKRQGVLRDRNIDFVDLAELFSLPYLEDQRLDDPEQCRIIGFVNGHGLSSLSTGKIPWES